MKKIINSVILLYYFLLFINAHTMQRAAQAMKQIRPKTAHLKPFKPLPTNTPTKLIVAPIEYPTKPQGFQPLIPKGSFALPPSSSQFKLPKEASVISSWALVDLINSNPTTIIEALNNNTQPTVDSFNRMIEAQKINNLRVGFATHELIETLGEQAELLFTKNRSEWFTLKNESNEIVFESRPIPGGYMFLKKLAKDTEPIILGEQAATLKNTFEKLHIPADLKSKFLKTTQADFEKLFNTELKEVQRVQLPTTEKAPAQAKEKDIGVDINEAQPHIDNAHELIAKKDNSLFTEMIDSGLYADSSYIKNNQEKLARLRSVPANAESAETFFEQLQDNFQKKKAKAAKKSEKIAAQQATKTESVQLQTNPIAQDRIQIKPKVHVQTSEQIHQETQIKIAELAEQIKDAQKELEQEIKTKNQLNAEIQLKKEEARIKAEVDAEYEQLLNESAEIEHLEQEIANTITTLEQLQTKIEKQESLAQENQEEQKKAAQQITEDETLLQQITDDIHSIQQARENIRTIKQQELDTANRQYTVAHELEQQKIIQQLKDAQDQLRTTETFINAEHAKKIQQLDLLEKDAQERFQQETHLIAEQKRKTQEDIEKDVTAQETQLVQETKELERQKEKLKEIIEQKHSSEQTIKNTQIEALEAEQTLRAAQENTEQALIRLEQAKQERIALESRQKAQEALHYGEKKPVPHLPSQKIKEGISIHPLIPKEIIFNDIPEKRPLIDISKSKPETDQETQTIPAYTIPELILTASADKPTVKKSVSEMKNSFVSTQQQPSITPAYTMAEPSYNNNVTHVSVQKHTPSVTTQTNKDILPNVASSPQPQQRIQRNQGLSIPSFNQKYKQQTTISTKSITPQVNTATRSSTSDYNATLYNNNNNSETTYQQPESHWPTNATSPLNQSMNQQPSYNNIQTQIKKDFTSSSLQESSDRKQIQNEQSINTPQQLNKKTINENQSAAPQTIVEFTQKPVHWFWKLIALIINFVKKMLNIS